MENVFLNTLTEPEYIELLSHKDNKEKYAKTGLKSEIFSDKQALIEEVDKMLMQQE